MKKVEDEIPYSVGDQIKVSHPHLLYDYVIYQVMKKNVKNNSHGQVQLSTLERKKERADIEKFRLGDNIIVVDLKWFDRTLTKRTIKKL